MFVSPSGVVEKSIGLNKVGTMNVKINKNKYSKTFYTRFGNVFSLRDFHSVVLGHGEPPLFVVEELVDRYIEEHRAL